MTVCVIGYGPNALLARRFLTSLYRHTDPALFRLRAGLNEVEPATAEEFARFSDRYGNIELWAEPRNTFKNPLMQRMFHERPLDTRWTIWCDDDTHFVRSDWLQRLALKIERAPEVVAWGQLYGLDCADPRVLDWIRAASWYRGLPFLIAPQSAATGAVRFEFPTGGFWALRTDVVKALDWPDLRLVQAHDDFMLGEAFRQNGYRVGFFDRGVVINDAPRRNAAAPEVMELPPGS